MQSFRSLRSLAFRLLVLTLLVSGTGVLRAQSSSSSAPQSSSSSSSATPAQPEVQKPPSLIDPAGPQ
ncbi:MAG: hypothetical protein WBQ79_15475, partial [Acidobacteriaceae bacterium]